MTLRKPVDREPIDPDSRAARTILGFYRAVERFAPAGSWRRRAYRFGTGGVAGGARRIRAIAGGSSKEAPAAITFATAADPCVSLVVVDDGEPADLLRCLTALARHTPVEPYEVIVLGPGASEVVLRPIVAGVRWVGDLDPSVNAALGLVAQDCKAGIAVVLSTCVEVTGAALDLLVRAVNGEPRAVMVGPRIAAADGRVLHAGGLVLSDGRRLIYGTDGDLAQQELAYRRRVDGCSAAAFAVRTSAAAEVSVDGRWVAWCPPDDDDAATAIYEPGAVVLMHARDADDLPMAHEPAQTSTVVEKEVRRRVSGSWVVVVDVRVPQPDVDAGSVRLLQMLLSLRAEGHGVLFVPNDRDAGGAYGAALAEHGIEVLSGPVDLHSRLETMEDLVTAAVVARATVAWPYVLMIRRVLPDVPIYFDTVDLHFLREERGDAVRGTGPSPITTATRELELALVRACDRTFVVSTTEQELLGQFVPEADVRVLPLVQPVFPVVPGLAQRDGVLFVGGFDHDPNVDGVKWFLAEVFPRIHAVLPDCRVTVVGRRPPQDLVDSAPSGIDFLGWVSDLEPVYAAARVAVAPLRFGAGVKGKIVEAMSHGVPVVATAIGAEAMPLEHDVTTLIADEADAFADAVVRLLSDDVTWTRLSCTARERAERVYSVSAFTATLRGCLAPSTPPDLDFVVAVG